MKRTQISTGVSQRTREQADELAQKLGYSLRELVTLAIDRIYQEEFKMHIISRKLDGRLEYLSGIRWTSDKSKANEYDTYEEARKAREQIAGPRPTHTYGSYPMIAKK